MNDEIKKSFSNWFVNNSKTITKEDELNFIQILEIGYTAGATEFYPKGIENATKIVKDVFEQMGENNESVIDGYIETKYLIEHEKQLLDRLQQLEKGV